MRIYISHAAEAAEAATRLSRELKEVGHDPWTAELEVMPGDNWAEEIGRALSDADAMVVLLTPHAASSRWVRHEISYALGNERFEGRLFPVVVDGESRPAEDEVPWLPWPLRKFSWFATNSGHEDEVARQISSALGSAAA